MMSAVNPSTASFVSRDRLFDAAWRLSLSAVGSMSSGERLSIVIFHRVLPEPDPLFPDDPDVHRFNQICAWLAAWYRVLPLDEAVERLAQDSLPPRALAITFDDGYADNHDLAMPILQAHGLCATFFIATGFLNGGRMWNDTVTEALRETTQPSLDLTGLNLPGVAHLKLATLPQRRDAIPRLLNAMKYLPLAERRHLSECFAERAQVAPRRDLMMTGDRVQALALGGMQIGAHTVSHPIMARLDDASAERELARSKDELESLLKQPVTLFAYPNGKPGVDYSRRDVALVRRLGFKAAVSTAPGAACHADDRLFELPRFTPWDRSRWRFALRLANNLRVKAAVAE